MAVIAEWLLQIELGVCSGTSSGWFWHPMTWVTFAWHQSAKADCGSVLSEVHKQTSENLFAASLEPQSCLGCSFVLDLLVSSEHLLHSAGVSNSGVAGVNAVYVERDPKAGPQHQGCGSTSCRWLDVTGSLRDAYSKWHQHGLRLVNSLVVLHGPTENRRLNNLNVDEICFRSTWCY